MFQSLFSWNSLLNPTLLHPCPGLHPVSILVFVELALEQHAAIRPLVWKTVSILVFVELALEHDYRREDQHQIRWFQSLFSWNSLLNSAFCRTPAKYGTKSFQSLFSWNSLLNRRTYRQIHRHLLVSILVFVELALEPFGSSSAVSRFNSCFNPCFRGTRSWTRSPTLREAMKASFNPCFRGTRSWTKASDDYHRLLPQFQSLFSWNSLLNFLKNACNLQLSKFQSLFSWNSLLNIGTAGESLTIYVVSILVFVELALERGLTCAMYCTEPSFNPCFRGTRSWTVGQRLRTLGELLFQSLFSWNSLLNFNYGVCGRS